MKWIKEEIVKEALNYTTRKNFANGSGGCYHAARRLEILDEVCSHMPIIYKKWVYDDILVEALKYDSRLSFQLNSLQAYKAAKLRNILDDVCSHMKPKFTFWTYDTISKKALEFTSRETFKHEGKGAYQAAQYRGILGEVCGHMILDKKGSDNDCVYIWNVKGTNIYKIGVTSWELGLRRIKAVASIHKYSYDVVGMIYVEDARNIEKIILDTYTKNPIFMQELDGHTEFRVLTDTEVVEIIDFLYQEAVAIDTNDFKFELCTLI